MDNEINIKLTADNTQLSNALNEASISADQLTKSADALGIGLGKIGQMPAADSINGLSIKLREAKDALNAASPSATNFAAKLKQVQDAGAQLTAAQRNVQSQLSSTGTATSALVPHTDKAMYAMVNFNRVISDAPYGFIGIANNIQPMLESFQMLQKDTGSAMGAFKAMGSSLIGPAGILTAVSLVTSAILYYGQSSKKAESDTRNMMREVDDLNAKVRELAASYRDLAQAQSKNKQKASEDKSEAETKLATLREQKRLGGTFSAKGEFDRYSDAVMKKINDDIKYYEKQVSNYNEIINGGGKVVANMISLTKGFIEASQNGTAAITKFAKQNKLSETQLKQVGENVKHIKEDVFSLNGGLKQGINFEDKTLALSIGKQKKEIDASAKAWENYNNSVNNTSKPRQRRSSTKSNYDNEFERLKELWQLHKLDIDEWEKYLNSVIAKGQNVGKIKLDQLKQIKSAIEERNKLYIGDDLDAIGQEQTLTKQQKQYFDKIKESMIEQGAVWDESTKQFVIKMAIDVKPPKYEPYSLPSQDKIDISKQDMHWTDDQKKELEKMQETGQIVGNVFSSLGDTMVDAMFGADLSIKKVINSLGMMIAKIIATKAAMAVTSAILNVIFPGVGSVAMAAGAHKSGGIIGQPMEFGFINANKLKNLKSYSIGGLLPSGSGAMPIIAHANEMILNSQQQANLWKLIAGTNINSALPQKPVIVFEQVFDGQKFVEKTIRNMQGGLR